MSYHDRFLLGAHTGIETQYTRSAFVSQDVRQSCRGAGPGHFFRYTFSPTFSSRFGMVTFPSVEAMMIVFPDAEGPNSLDRSTLIVNIVPATVISTFFMIVAFQ